MSKILLYRGNTSETYTINAKQHADALAHKNNDFGRALRKMLEGWEAYAVAHEKRYEGKIGDDGLLGDYWANVGLAIKRLLDGDTGGWDCGSLAQNITEAIEEQGIATDGYCLTGKDGEQ